MATTTATAPAETVKVNVAIVAAVKAFSDTATKLEIAFDNVRNVAKAQTVKLGYTEKQLTGLLIEAGLPAARASEVKGFVFPAHQAARKELDKAMEINAKQTDNKKRVAKDVILALQRDKEGKLTLEKAIAAHKAKGTLSRSPGGETDQTAKPASKKAKTAEEIEAELLALYTAANTFAKDNGYDEKDSAAVFEESVQTVFSDDAEESEDESED